MTQTWIRTFRNNWGGIKGFRIHWSMVRETGRERRKLEEKGDIHHMVVTIKQKYLSIKTRLIPQILCLSVFEITLPTPHSSLELTIIGSCFLGYHITH